jgi:hypothetical protein
MHMPPKQAMEHIGKNVSAYFPVKVFREPAELQP